MPAAPLVPLAVASSTSSAATACVGSGVVGAPAGSSVVGKMEDTGAGVSRGDATPAPSETVTASVVVHETKLSAEDAGGGRKQRKTKVT